MLKSLAELQPVWEQYLSLRKSRPSACAEIATELRSQQRAWSAVAEPLSQKSSLKASEQRQFDDALVVMETMKGWLRQIGDDEAPAGSAGAASHAAVDGPGKSRSFGHRTPVADSLRAPSWSFTKAQVADLADAGAAKGTKVVSTTNVPYSPDYAAPEGFLREPTRIADYIPTFPLATGSIFYSRLTTATSAAEFVASGALKPESTVNITRAEAVARKLAHWVDVEDEVFDDTEAFEAFMAEELIAGVIDRESGALLNGTGVAPQFAGILNVPGILVQAKGTESSLETLFLANQKLRTGPSKVVGEMVALHPDDYSEMRLQKALGSGEYLAGDPSQDALVPTLWGLDVVQTTALTPGTGLLGAWSRGAKIHLRKPPSVEVGRSGTGIKSNVMTMVAEERLALEVNRPTCFVSITGI